MNALALTEPYARPAEILFGVSALFLEMAADMAKRETAGSHALAKRRTDAVPMTHGIQPKFLPQKWKYVYGAAGSAILAYRMRQIISFRPLPWAAEVHWLLRAACEPRPTCYTIKAVKQKDKHSGLLSVIDNLLVEIVRIIGNRPHLRGAIGGQRLRESHPDRRHG